MGTQYVGTAGFKYEDSGTQTINLGSRLYNIRPNLNRERHIADSLDRTVRNVIEFGTAAAQEITADIRFHDDPQELLDMIDVCLGGVQLDYYENVSSPLGTDPHKCLLLSATVSPDPDLAGKGQYMATFTLRATGTTTDFDVLYALGT